ncbi:hypothetical protein [Streptomyces sp. WP-1]|uniref:hypothetical protein n=1 Tax=Streptomyces sp. WP-1 TaxID=3041497 RepID=UPI00264A4CDB|nr:hypothetical protein [Streptomyces sp. WP-1]WKE67791.1 hypothetical protein QHG49_01450 [Streptomyces sp. WP-1]
MTSDHDMVWRRCAYLGRVLLPLVDQEPWRRPRRRESLRDRGIDTAVGERLIEIFAVLAAHAVALDASLSAAEFDGLPLLAVAEAVTCKRDFELLAGLPDTFADVRKEQAVNVFRLSGEVRHALAVLAARTPTRSSTCGDVFRRAAEAGLAP